MIKIQTIKKNNGFTLVDTITSIALLGMAVLIIGSIYPILNLSDNSKDSLIADTIANNQLQKLKTESFESLVETTDTNFSDDELLKLNSGVGTYSVLLFDADNDGTLDEDIKEIEVEVTWIQNNVTKNRVVRSLITNYSAP